MNKTVKYMILLLLIFTTLTMPLTVSLFKSSREYSMFNTDWNGISSFALLAYKEGKTVMPIFGTFDTVKLGEMSGVLLIIGPNMAFTPEEKKQIKLFLERGNTLFIADDFGYGNEILNGLNLSVRISKDPLRDFFYENDDRIIVSVRINESLLAKNVTKITTNEPSAIITPPSGEAYTSRIAMINFHRSMFPLMTEVKYSKGRVVILSDPDVLINQLYKKNEPFLRNLVEYLGGDKFYIDEAHHPDFNLYTASTVIVTRLFPRDRAINVMFTLATIILLQEIGAFKILWKSIEQFVSSRCRQKGSIEKLALALAKEKGWDEKEVTEMLERMGG